MAWAYGSYVMGRLLVLVATAILARLLTPADFGVVALALTFMAFLDMVSTLGLGESLLIADEEEVEEKAETAFVMLLAMGVVLFVASLALGPPAASFYDQEQLKSVVPALGLTFLLKSAGLAHHAIAQKHMDFRLLTLAELVEVVVRGVTGIVLAFAGAGVWSLVIGYLAGAAAMTVALWILVPWRPRLRPRREHVRELMSFGGALTGVAIIAALTLNVDKLLIGKSLGAAPLGLYSLASRLPELLLINLTMVAGAVLFPAFAAVDRPALGRAFVTSLRYLLILVLPVGAFLGVLAEPLLVTAFGEQWRSAAPAMQLFTVMALLSPITIVCGTVWKATGQGAMLLRFSCLELVVLVPPIVLVVDHGITAVAACQAGSTMVVVAVGLPIIARKLGVPARALAVVIWPPVLAATAMAAALLVLQEVLARPIPLLIAGSAIGAIVYGGVVWLVARSTVRDLMALVRPRLRVTPPPAPAPEDGAPTPAAIIDKAGPG